MSESAHKNNEIVQMQQALARATEAVAGDPNSDPLTVFPNPRSKERREDVVFDADNLAPEQEADFRAAMAELGPGRKEDKGLDTDRLSNEMSRQVNPHYNSHPSVQHEQYEWKALLEGGQYHKMKAELDLTLEQHILPSIIMASGSRDRKLGDKERELTARLMGVAPEEVADSEFEVAKQMFSLLPNFTPLEDGEATGNAEYRMDADNTYRIFPVMPGSENHGQFVSIGRLEVNGQKIPIDVLRIDRFPDPEHPDDPSKYIQPNNAQKISCLTYTRGPVGAPDTFRAHGEVDSNVALVTSATYEPTCELAVKEAVENIDTRMTAQAISYGTERLAKVKGEEPKQPDLNQLAGEAYKAAKMLQSVQ